MEEINLKELMQYFKNNILIIILILLTFLVAGNFYSLVLKDSKYQSDTTVILINGTSNNGSTSQSDIQLSKTLVDTYSIIIKSNRVLSKVITNLQLDYNEEELKKKITVTSVDNTEIIKITATDTNNVLAKDIANQVAEVFQNEIVGISQVRNVSVSIIDEAEVETKAYNKNIIKENIIYILASICLSIIVIFTKFYFDTTIKTPEAIEEKLKLTVLGIVPKI